LDKVIKIGEKKTRKTKATISRQKSVSFQALTRANFSRVFRRKIRQQKMAYAE